VKSDRKVMADILGLMPDGTFFLAWKPDCETFSWPHLYAMYGMSGDFASPRIASFEII